MKSRAIIWIMLALLFFSMLKLVNDIQPTEATNGTIYIRANGAIEPSEANITTYDNVIYTFNGTNYYPIVVERSNIIIDGNGYAVQGKNGYPSAGISLQDIDNVTITNVTVEDFFYGIKLNLTSNIKILGNILNNTSRGLSFLHSFNDTACGNNITNNSDGAEIWHSRNTTISGNNLSKNKGISSGHSIVLYYSTGNQIYGNNITDGHIGIKLENCNDTQVYQNNVTAHSWEGISLFYCTNISLDNNLLNDNLYGLSVGGEELNHYLHSIDASNFVDGKPVYYLINQNHLLIDASTHPAVGYFALINSTNVTVEGLNLTKNGEGILIAYTNNSKIQNSNLTDNYCGISLFNSLDNTITQNSLQRNDEGVDVYSSLNNTVSENILEDNYDTGIELYYSPNCTISKNEIRGSNYGIDISYSSNTIISENHISAIQNCISISECSENIIYANNLANSGYGIELSVTSRNIVHQNNITNNQCGIYAYDNVNDNVIRKNTIANNTEAGIYMEESENNTIYHNNFLNNTQQVSSDATPNTWDNGYPSGGNYWSDHPGVDEKSGINQDETGSDGIGDTSYDINENNTDRYPLMGSIHVFDAGTWDEMPYNIDIISNSTVSNFQIDIDQKIMSFNVSSLQSTNGFCRMIIPNIIVQDFWQGNYMVLLNGEPCSFRNWTDTANTYIYINYTHSDHQIIIVSEFPSAIILTLFPVLFITTIILAKQKRRKTELNHQS